MLSPLAVQGQRTFLIVTRSVNDITCVRSISQKTFFAKCFFLSDLTEELAKALKLSYSRIEQNVEVKLNYSFKVSRVKM